MDALARPGRIVTLIAQTTARRHCCRHGGDRLTLFDHDTPVWIDAPVAGEAVEWLRFHTAAPVVTDPKDCAFAIVTDAARLPAFDRFNLGNHEYPDQSTTDHRAGRRHWRAGSRCDLTGPGIQSQARSPEPLPRRHASNASPTTVRCFPRGIDLRLRCRQRRRRAAAFGARRPEDADMYVAVKGGEQAIENAHKLLAHERRGDPTIPELSLDQISRAAHARRRSGDDGRLALRSRTGGACDQAGARRPDRGDFPAARVPRDAAALRRRPSRSRPPTMAIRRRISATFKDLPGGQVLGPTFDYTHRLLDPQSARRRAARAGARRGRPDDAMPRVTDLLGRRRSDRALGAGERRRAGRRSHPRSVVVSGRARSAAAESRARRRGLPARARLFDAARLRPHASVRRRNPARRGRGRVLRRGRRLCRAARRASPSPSAR